MAIRLQQPERASRISANLAAASYRTSPAFARRGEAWFARRIAILTAKRRVPRDRRLTQAAGATRPLLSAQDIVELLITLRHPARLPRKVRSRWSAGAGREVVRLVLHRILEIECDGRFVSGAAAASAIFESPGAERLTGSEARDTSLEALRYGAELPLDDSAELALRLYGYNRIPLQPVWRQRLATPAAVAAWLALDRGRLETSLTRHWLGKSEPAPGDVWLFWTPRTPNAHDAAASNHYKVYVSVAPEQAPNAFRHTVHALVETGPTPFKVAADPHGFFRPDKLIVYFDSWARLTAFTRALGPRLQGLAPHAVPFTAAIGSVASVSWGVDFPARVSLLKLSDGESWRMWVAQRLAHAICEARREGLTRDASVEFALNWIWLDGVDPRTWAPDGTLLAELARA